VNKEDIIRMHLRYLPNLNPSVLERLATHDLGEEIIDYTVSIDEENSDYKLVADELNESVIAQDVISKSKKNSRIPDRFIVTKFGTLVLKVHEDGTTKKEEIESFLKSLLIDARGLDGTSSKIRDNEVIMLIAASSDRNGGEALVFASDRLKSDSKFVQKALKLNKGNFHFTTEANRDDKEIIKVMMEYDKYALLSASPRLQGMLDMVEFQLKHGGDCWLLQNLDQNLWKKKDFVAMAIKNTEINELSKYVAKIADKYNDDVEIMQLLIKHDITNIKFASSTLIRNNSKFKEIYARVKTFEKLKNGQIDVRQLDKKYFEDEEFYDMVSDELEYCLKEIEIQRKEIEAKGGIKNQLKGFTFTSKKKRNLAMLMSYISIANKQSRIQEEKKRRQERREEFKGYIKDVIEEINGNQQTNEDNLSQ